MFSFSLSPFLSLLSSLLSLPFFLPSSPPSFSSLSTQLSSICRHQSGHDCGGQRVRIAFRYSVTTGKIFWDVPLDIKNMKRGIIGELSFIIILNSISLLLLSGKNSKEFHDLSIPVFIYHLICLEYQVVQIIK